jgi:hypothetical protein
MRKLLFVAALLAGGSALAQQQFQVGQKVHIGLNGKDGTIISVGQQMMNGGTSICVHLDSMGTAFPNSCITYDTMVSQITPSGGGGAQPQGYAPQQYQQPYPQQQYQPPQYQQQPYQQPQYQQPYQQPAYQAPQYQQPAYQQPQYQQQPVYQAQPANSGPPGLGPPPDMNAPASPGNGPAR